MIKHCLKLRFNLASSMYTKTNTWFTYIPATILDRFNPQISPLNVFIRMIVENKVRNLLEYRFSLSRTPNKDSRRELDELDFINPRNDFWGNCNCFSIKNIELQIDIQMTLEGLPHDLHEVC